MWGENTSQYFFTGKIINGHLHFLIHLGIDDQLGRSRIGIYFDLPGQLFIFQAGEAEGDLVTDFSGINGQGDKLVFEGYGDDAALIYIRFAGLVLVPEGEGTGTIVLIDPENATLPFTMALANKGYRRALAEDPHLRAGLNVADGKVTCKPVAEAHGLDYHPAEEVLGISY